MKKLRVIITRGRDNNFLQDCHSTTLAASNRVQGGALFLDEAACSDSVECFGLSVEALNPGLDDVQQAETIWKEEVSEADQVLTC